MATVDHRRVVADRNRTAILDASERLLARRAPLNMAAVAAEAGVSRPTLYAHFKTLADVLEAAVDRSVAVSLAAFDAAAPEEGPPGAALDRMLEASWTHLAAADALARGAAEHLPPAHLHRTHAPLMARMAALVERGRTAGEFRDDLPTEWLVTAYFSLIHGADDYARARRVARARVLEMLRTSVHEVLGAR